MKETPDTATTDRDHPTHPHRRGLQFDPTINAGHLISLAGMCVALFMAMSAVDKRLVVLEEAKLYQREKDAMQDQAQQRSDEFISRRLEKFENKLDAAIDVFRSAPK